MRKFQTGGRRSRRRRRTSTATSGETTSGSSRLEGEDRGDEDELLLLPLEKPLSDAGQAGGGERLLRGRSREEVQEGADLRTPHTRRRLPRSRKEAVQGGGEEIGSAGGN